MSGGLASVQQWAHDHIARCPSCGSWELVEERELQRRAEHEPRPVLCAHLRRSFAAEETALADGKAAS